MGGPRSESRSVPLTNESGSGRPNNLRIRIWNLPSLFLRIFLWIFLWIFLFVCVTVRGFPMLANRGVEPETHSKRQATTHDCLTIPRNQPRKDPFNLYSLSPHLPQFQQSVGGHPSLVSLGRAHIQHQEKAGSSLFFLVLRYLYLYRSIGIVCVHEECEMWFLYGNVQYRGVSAEIYF
jgi:hypothetical protein